MGKKVDVTWTCDRSGTVHVVADPSYPDQFPPGWRYVSGSTGLLIFCPDCLTAFDAWIAATAAPVA